MRTYNEHRFTGYSELGRPRWMLNRRTYAFERLVRSLLATNLPNDEPLLIFRQAKLRIFTPKTRRLRAINPARA